MNKRVNNRCRLKAATVFAGLLAVSVSAGEPSLQERIDAASPGDEIVVDGGVHQGNLLVDRPLTLTGIDRPHIKGDGDGHTVAIRSEGVTLQGFRITDSGLNLSADHAAVHVKAANARIRDNDISEALHGIYVHGVGGVRVEGNRIRGIEVTEAGNIGAAAPASLGSGDLCSVSRDRRGNGVHFWNSSGNSIVGNEISGVRDGIYFSFTRESRVERNLVRDARYGLHYMYSDRNYFSRNRFTENVAGAALMFSKEVVVRDNDFVDNRGSRAYGLLLHNVDSSTIENNRMKRNRVGYYMQNSHANTARRNHFVLNYIGLRLTSSSTSNLFSYNEIGRNLHNISLAGRDNSNEWAENGVGNRWLDSPTLDLDGDGVSALPHREVDVFGGTREDFPFVAFLSESPGIKALRFALQRSPVPDTHFITDSRPLAPGSRHSVSDTLEARRNR